MEAKICKECYREFLPKRKEQTYCSRACASVRKGRMSTRWMSQKRNAYKGGAIVHRDGYIRVLVGDHPWPRKNYYMYEHIKVMEDHLDRRLEKNEVVHHIDGDRANNKFDNLVLMNRSDHIYLHQKQNHTVLLALLKTIALNYMSLDEWLHDILPLSACSIHHFDLDLITPLLRSLWRDEACGNTYQNA